MYLFKKPPKIQSKLIPITKINVMRQTYTFIHVHEYRYGCGNHRIHMHEIQVSQASINSFFVGPHFVENVDFSRIWWWKEWEKKGRKSRLNSAEHKQTTPAIEHILKDDKIQIRTHVKILMKLKTVCMFGLSCGNGSYFVRHKSGTCSLSQ